MRPLILALACTLLTAAEPEAVRADLAARAAALDAAGQQAVPGADGWWFLTRELRSYGRGEFWGDAAAAIQPAAKEADPLACLLSVQAQAAKSGVALLLVPVPGKLVVHPDRLAPPLTLAAGERPDAQHRRFFATLREQGFQVLDLADDFNALRAAGTDPFCHQDTHWSPAGLRLAAERIAAVVKSQPWHAATPKVAPVGSDLAVAVRGDLARIGEPDGTTTEALTVRQVRLGADFVVADPASPLVVIGDSHCLIYDHPLLLTEHAGLTQQLAELTGVVPDTVAEMAGGINTPRSTLRRRKDNLAGKKCLVWVFAARSLTESDEGWKTIPMVR